MSSDPIAPIALDAPDASAPDGPTGVRRVARWHRLAPVEHRWRWMAGGLAIQAAGIGVLVAWAYAKYKHDAALGMAAKATVQLVWQETVHSRAGVAVLACAAVVFALGCVLAARPFARTVELLLVVVPLAAIAGVLVLGALVFVLAILWMVASMGDMFTGNGGGGGSGKKRAAEPGPEEAPA